MVSIANCLIDSIASRYPNTIVWYSHSAGLKAGRRCNLEHISEGKDYASLWRFHYRLSDDLSELMKLKDNGINEWLSARSSIEGHISIPSSRNMGLNRIILDEQDFTTIEGFCPFYEVLRSLQKPMKLWLRGSDGVKYAFLLKFNDELRKDNRVLDLLDHFNVLNAKRRSERTIIRSSDHI